MSRPQYVLDKYAIDIKTHETGESVRLEWHVASNAYLGVEPLFIQQKNHSYNYKERC